jgi:hypothetical protein
MEGDLPGFAFMTFHAVRIGKIEVDILFPGRGVVRRSQDHSVGAEENAPKKTQRSHFFLEHDFLLYGISLANRQAILFNPT